MPDRFQAKLITCRYARSPCWHSLHACLGMLLGLTVMNSTIRALVFPFCHVRLRALDAAA